MTADGGGGVTLGLLARDLFFASRIASAAERAGVPFARYDDPSVLPPPATLRVLLVSWDERSADWGGRILEWCANAPESARPRVIPFGPHTDLEAHAAARAAGLGPMWARSKLLASLSELLAES